jgi:hypothetical protein
MYQSILLVSVLVSGVRLQEARVGKFQVRLEVARFALGLEGNGKGGKHKDAQHTYSQDHQVEGVPRDKCCEAEHSCGSKEFGKD